MAATPQFGSKLARTVAPVNGLVALTGTLKVSAWRLEIAPVKRTGPVASSPSGKVSAIVAGIAFGKAVLAVAVKVVVSPTSRLTTLGLSVRLLVVVYSTVAVTVCPWATLTVTGCTVAPGSWLEVTVTVPGWTLTVAGVVTLCPARLTLMPEIGVRCPQTKATAFTCTVALGQSATKRIRPEALVTVTRVLELTVPCPSRIRAEIGCQHGGKTGVTTRFEPAPATL